jgi:hypothetical protein
MGLYQIKRFLHIKRNNYHIEETLHRMRENLFEKGLISRIYKECKKLETKRTNNPIYKWAN